MSAERPQAAAPCHATRGTQSTSAHSSSDGACAACLARSALLALLSARIEHAARDADRLLDLLCLDDRQLIEALGGRRRRELHARYSELCDQAARARPQAAICRHSSLLRKRLGARQAPTEPAALHLHGDRGTLAAIIDRPIVAILGTEQASDYGMEMAASLARALTCSGIGIASGFGAGIGAAAHRGAIEAGGAPLAVMPSGADVCQPACMRGLHRLLGERGAAISELPAGFRARRWSKRATERILAALAGLVIVVESEHEGLGMLAAALAAGRGAPVAALPGRITSPGARGPHALLRQGASLVTSPQDALNLLYGMRAPAMPNPLLQLDRDQRAVMELVGSGHDTLASLCESPHRARLLVSLSDLRSRGLLARGDEGRYLPRVSLDQETPAP